MSDKKYTDATKNESLTNRAKPRACASLRSVASLSKLDKTEDKHCRRFLTAFS